MPMIEVKAKRVGQVPDSQREFTYQGFSLKDGQLPTLDEILGAVNGDENEFRRIAAVGFNHEARSKAADPFYGLIPDFSKSEDGKDRTEDEVQSLERTWRNTANGLLKLGKPLDEVKKLMGV